MKRYMQTVLLMLLSIVTLYTFLTCPSPLFRSRRFQLTLNDVTSHRSSNKSHRGSQKHEYLAESVDDLASEFSVEDIRRHLVQTERSMWIFFYHQLNKLRKEFGNSNDKKKQAEFNDILNNTLEHASEYHRIIGIELEKLTEQTRKEWKMQEEKTLKNIVQRKLYQLQNPKNCSATPVLFCDLRNPYGFAAGLQNVLNCFINAFHSKRMLVLKTSHWHYDHGGWEILFRPLSDACTTNDVKSFKNVYKFDFSDPKKESLLTKLPNDIGPRLVRIHNNPMAWWYGQFVEYLMRPNQRFQAYLHELQRNIDFNTSVAGIHIRRTDKIGVDGISHRVEEYIDHVEDYFKRLELKSQNVSRQVFIATDTPKVIEELKTKYPSYTFHYNIKASTLASKQTTRYTNESLWGLLGDVFTLSRANFVVGTLSSTLSLVIYELMQAVQGPDASDKLHSLDAEFQYFYLPNPDRVALYDHRNLTATELSFKVGDILVLKEEDRFENTRSTARGKLADGFVYRMNLRNEKKGMIPFYKTKCIYDFVEFPIFKEDDD